MTRTEAIEQRLNQIEGEISELKQRMAGGCQPGWLKRLQGSMKGMRGFPKMVELGRRIRASDRPETAE